jgi:hypothetical protein
LDGIHHARKLGEQAIAGRLEHAPAMVGDPGIDDVAFTPASVPDFSPISRL